MKIRFIIKFVKKHVNGCELLLFFGDWCTDCI